MDYTIESVNGKAMFHRVAVGQIGLYETVGCSAFLADRLKLGQARLFQPDIIIIIDDVEADDLVSPLEKQPGNMEPDEARIAGDEDFHVRTFVAFDPRPYRIMRTLQTLRDA